MKFVIKSGSTVKLYSGQIKIEALAQFLKENFACWNSNNLIYRDNDGDVISVTAQEDIDTLLSLNEGCQYIKFEVNANMTESPVKKEERKEETIKQTQAEEEIKPLKAERSLTKGKSSCKNKNQKCWQKKRKCRRNKSSQSSSEEKLNKKEAFEKLQESFTTKIAQIVDQRIKSMIPCIKNQLENNTVQSLIQSKPEDLQHQGIICSGCNMNPLAGIRYKCLQCPNFNLCQNCQNKVEHEHNLLKMKKPDQKNEKTDNMRQMFKLGRKALKQMFRHRRTSSSSQNQGGECGKRWSHHKQHGHGHGHGHRHGHGHGHGHRDLNQHNKFNDEEKKNFRFNKRMFKMIAVFGQRQNLKEFVEKNVDIKAKDLIDIYAAENNINIEDVQTKRDQMRRQKLAAFYDCPKEEFDQTLKEYPKLNFREIIMKLKESGKRTYTGQNFKRMRQALGKNSRGKSPRDEKIKERVSRSPKGKGFSGDKAQKRNLRKGSQMKEKGKILQEMKSLFGQDQGKTYFKFIEQNYQLGGEGIIAKWIQQTSQ